MRVGVALVHYRTPDLATTAVEALRRFAGLGCDLDLDLDLDLVLVDNGSGQAGRDVLASLEASHDVRVVTPSDNLGYAGGVNLGFDELSAGELKGRGPDVLVAMNPDVTVGPTCLAELVRALGDGTEGAGVAGPQFLWGADAGSDENVVLLPPADPVGRLHELGRYLAESRGGYWARRARAAWRRHAQHHWTATSDTGSYALSGALLAITADAWSRVGRFDEGYRLYFEETDWLRRARKLGVVSRYVPAAKAHHGYARSTPQEPQAAAWFADSERRFRRRWYGGAFDAFLRRLARRNPPRPAEVDDGSEGPPEVGPATRWIEISASPLGLPSGGIHLPHGWSAGDNTAGDDPLPEIVRTRAREMTLYRRTVDARGRESSAVLIDPT